MGHETPASTHTTIRADACPVKTYAEWKRKREQEAWQDAQVEQLLRDI